MRGKDGAVEATYRGRLVEPPANAIADPGATVPLVVSQVNPDALSGHHGIIANPNCSTMQLAPLLKALQEEDGRQAEGGFAGGLG